MNLRRWFRKRPQPSPAPSSSAVARLPRGLVPVLHPSDFFSGRRASFYRRALAGDLFVAYGVEKPLRLLTAADLKDVDLGALDAASADNLRDRVGDVELTELGPVHQLTAGGELESSLLLLEEVREQLRDELKGDLVAAVPARELVAFTGTQMRGGVRSLARWVERAFAATPAPLSSGLLVWEGDRWHAFSSKRDFA